MTDRLRSGRRDDAEPSAPTVVYFGQDRTDSKVITRIENLQNLGYAVVGFTFHRVKFNRDHTPTWPNVDLGHTADYAYFERVRSLLIAMVRVVKHRRMVRPAELVFARNIDMAVLALFARWVGRSKAALAYEVLDVHRSLIGEGRAPRALRVVERWVLRRAGGLIVSSEGYIRNYFVPVQGFDGPWFVLENKVPASLRTTSGDGERHASQADGPLVIGWCGTLRCLASLDLLIEIARQNRDRVAIAMHGFPTETGLDEFIRRIAAEPNVTYYGGYKSPDDLAAVYAGIDLNWTIEFSDSDRSENFKWLLPNRFYEGGCYSVPMLAVEGTETARRVASIDGGWIVTEPIVGSVSRLLGELTPDDLRRKRANLRAAPLATFWETDDLALICDQLRTATRRSVSPAAA